MFGPPPQGNDILQQLIAHMLNNPRIADGGGGGMTMLQQQPQPQVAAPPIPAPQPATKVFGPQVAQRPMPQPGMPMPQMQPTPGMDRMRMGTGWMGQMGGRL